MARGKVTIDFASHYGDWTKMRKSWEVEDWIMSAAEQAAADATLLAQARVQTLRRPGDAILNPEYRAELTHGSKRVRATVWTANYAAKFAESRWGFLKSSVFMAGMDVGEFGAGHVYGGSSEWRAMQTKKLRR